MKSFSLKNISGLMIAILLIAGLSAVFAYSHKAHADDVTLTVTTLADDVDDATCTTDHCTLREAIAAAAPSNTIAFASGLTGTLTLTSALTISEPLNITGPGADKVVINGNGSAIFVINTDPGAAVSISGLTLEYGSNEGGGEIANGGSDLTVSNVTFKNGEAIGGGAIFSGGGSLTVTDSTFVGNAGEMGGGAIYMIDGTGTITDSTFLGNFTQNSGGAIYVDGTGTSLAISGSTFDGNETQSGQGGAIYDNDDTPGTLTLTNSEFNSNMSDTQGGAIYTYANLVSTSSSFTNNFGGSTGGAIYANGATVALTNTDFTNDTADGDGGAVYITNDGVNTVTNGTFEGNYANDCDAGAIYTDSSSELNISGTNFKNNNSDCAGGALYLNANSDITGATFTGNKSFEDGGAIDYNGGDIHTIEATTFTDNTAENYGGAITQDSGSLSITDHSSFTGNINDVYDDCDDGGAIDSEGTNLTVTDTSFTNNKAATCAYGGAIYMDSPGALTRDDFSGNMSGDAGGALYIDNGPVTISASTFYRNITGDDDGGAIYHDSGDLTVENSSFVENIAGNDDAGGAIFGNGSSLTITGTEFDHNAAPYYEGGAVWIGENTSIDTSGFIGNTAYGGSGGGLYIEGGPLTVSVTNSTFAENASQYGGGIYTDGGMVTLTNLTLSNNTATTNGGNVYTGEGTVTTKNSIFAGGTSSNCNTDLTTNGHNISSDGTCGFTDGTDQESVNPKLDPEGPKVPPSGPTLNGSPYLSIVGIAADSRAVDNGDSCTSTDELGGTRVGTCDIGAYEYNASTVPAISSSQVFNTPNIIVTRLDDPDGGTCSSGTNCSLRQAVALSTSGQTIGFSSGLVGTLTLGGFITVDHPITISGPGEKLLTISGNSSTNLFDVTSAGSLELDHLTIANGQNLTGDAGAIYNLGPVNTSHVTFRNNAASGEGGAIYSDCGVENRNQTFDYTTFEGNYSGEAGGAIYTCGNSSGLNTNTITNGTLVDNFANGKGGAIYASSESVSVSGSTLDGNYGADEGGAIYTNMTYSAEPIITVSNSTFAGNWAQDGGAISNGLSSGVHLDVSGDTSFLGNFAYDNGGAINLSGAYIDSMSATFQGNFSNWDAGGALYLGGLLDSSVTINNSTFTDNVAGDDVGGAIAIFSEGTDLAMTGTTSFTGNSALYDNAGGAIYDDAHSLTLTGTTFNNNTTWSGTGGAIYVQNGDLTMTGASFNNNVAMDTNAGAIDYEASGALSVTNSSFVGNQAIYGGSGAVLQGESTAAATVSGSTFTNNMAYDDPVGAWYQYAGDLTVTNSTFTGNSSTNQVGGINTDSGNLTITGTTFDHNSSVGYGASLYDHQSDGYTTTIKNSTFYRNDAPWDESGGYYHDGGSNAVINNVTFDQNVSSTDGGNAFTVYGSPTVITNSIFAGSPLGSCIDYNGGIDQVNSTNNIDDGSGCFDAGVNNQNNVNPLSIFASAGLADNGGQTATVDLANSSPALDAGNDATCETTDQTGASRPYGAHCDVGSVESHALLDETAPETPVASPSTGTYSGAQSVILSSVGSDSIRYSTSVAPADCSSGTIYSGAISIASSETLYVRACKSSNSTSSTASFAYTIIPPSSGSVSGGSSVGWVPSTSSTQSKGITSSNTFVIQNNGTTYHFPRSQKTGVKGDDVKVLQQFLNTHGFVIVPNGPGSKGKETKTFGPATKKALINYQKSKGLNPDGILGPKTRAMIESDMNK